MSTTFQSQYRKAISWPSIPLILYGYFMSKLILTLIRAYLFIIMIIPTQILLPVTTSLKKGTGSYMTTEKEFKPKFMEYSLRGKRYVAELRGLWKMEKGISMGGPFVSITTLDEKRNRVVTVEGMVYAAGYDKRNFVRQVEAIVYSLNFNY